MQEIQYSRLLSMILDKAESLCQEYSCNGITRDYIIVAAIQLLTHEDPSESPVSDEKQKALSIIKRYSTDELKLSTVLETWRNKEASFIEKIMISKYKGEAANSAKAASLSEVTADLFLAKLIESETGAMIALHTSDNQTVEDQTSKEKKQVTQSMTKIEPTSDTNVSSSHTDMASLVNKTRELQTNLQEVVLGQRSAVSSFITGYFNSELQASIAKDRQRPRGTFLFAGPPGVGKTFMAEKAAGFLGLQSQRFDMSEYIGPNATDELCGSDANYKASKEGLLTGFVAKNPQCILIFDEIEKASLEVIHLFLQILDAGRIRDNRTDNEVSFKDSILIFTTNAGKDLYEDKENENLSLLPRDVILDALKKEKKPKSDEPVFPAAICSRFASGNVIMFNHLRAHTLQQIVEKQFKIHQKNMNDSMKVSIDIDKSISTALLLAEGASADARMVTSRANSFFSSELFEFYRLLPKDQISALSEQISSIQISIDFEHCDASIKKLFIPSDNMHIIAYCQTPLVFDSDIKSSPIVHYVSSFEECETLLDTEKIEMLICELDNSPDTSPKSYLNIEDVDTPARTFLYAMLKKHQEIPVVLLEQDRYPFSDEEKESFFRRGIRGFLTSEQKGHSSIQEYLEDIFQQNSLSELARSNQVLHYETAQRLSNDHTSAQIILFDLSLEKAIKAEDAENIMSLLSTPKVKFDDVIGAEEAKKELKYFVSYMNNPRKYKRSGAAAPKGILLYGPPGTGKTMLAKAFAAESGATFISTEGNQFFKGIVGQGASMVHRLFATARKYAPSVLFVDEIDAIARVRTGRDTDLAQDSEQILTAFFAEMDGFSSDHSKPVFVLGATNYGVETNSNLKLDPAMLRRFDRRLLIDLPNVENRSHFLELKIKQKPIFHISNQEIKSLADRSTGMSLAQLSSFIDLALRSALQNNSEFIDDNAIEEAFETFNSGEKKNWDKETILRTARHEAGHALISWLTGEKPTYVTIVSRGNYGGYMQNADQEDRMGYTKKELQNRIATALGGRAAEIVFYGPEDGISTGASGDLRTATDIARKMICEFGMDKDYGMSVINPNQLFQSTETNLKINNILNEQLKAAIAHISENRHKIDALVEKLLQFNHLNKEEINQIFSEECRNNAD